MTEKNLPATVKKKGKPFYHRTISPTTLMSTCAGQNKKKFLVLQISKDWWLNIPRKVQKEGVFKRLALFAQRYFIPCQANFSLSHLQPPHLIFYPLHLVYLHVVNNHHFFSELPIKSTIIWRTSLTRAS